MRYEQVPMGSVFCLQGGYYYKAEDGVQLVRLLSVTRKVWNLRLLGPAGISVAAETPVECVRDGDDASLVTWEKTGIPEDFKARKAERDAAAKAAEANPAPPPAELPPPAANA